MGRADDRRRAGGTGDGSTPSDGLLNTAPADHAPRSTVPPVAAPLARHGRLAQSRAAKTILKFVGIAVSVLLVSTAAVAGYAIWDVTSTLKPGVALPNDSAGPVPEIGAIEGGVNLLLVGSDSGEGDPQYGERGERLNDVTILLHIAQDHSSATAVSFPRDMFVDIPACPASEDGTTPGTEGGFTDKMNTSLSYGGLGCSVATVQQLTGLDIPFAAEIEFNGVIEMSNAVGGVPVCIAEPIQDEQTNTFLAAGEQTLQGLDALQFLRTRYGLQEGSDLARIGNQQMFLSSLMRTIKSDGTLTDPLKLYSLAKAAAKNMVLSSELQSPDRMVSIAKALADIDLAKVAFLQYPVATTDDGLEPLTDDATALFDALAVDAPVTLSGELGKASQTDPNAPPAETPPAEEPPAETPPAETPPTDAAPPADPATPGVTLPPSISGQTAADHTCTVGRSLDEQE